MPGLTDTLLRTMTISSAMASEKVLAQADLVIKPNPIGVGLMEYHQIDRAREAGRITRPVKRCHKSWSWCTAEPGQGR